jgi:hypothetical protein
MNQDVKDFEIWLTKLFRHLQEREQEDDNNFSEPNRSYMRNKERSKEETFPKVVVVVDVHLSYEKFQRANKITKRR